MDSKNKWKKAAAATLVGLCGLALAACSNNSSSSQGSKQNLNWMEKTEVQTMDPSKVTDSTSSNQLNNTLEGLYRLDKNSKVEPGIATKTVISKDGKSWVFTLRKNAKWSNGDPVTAKDFVYSWQRTVNPKTGSEYSYLFSGIKNADQIVAGKKPVSSLGVTAQGNYKLKVTLERRIPYFRLLMGFTVFAPQNQNAVKKYGSNYGTAAKYQVYNGPFVMKGWSGSNLSWKLVKNPNYWDKKDVKLNSINYSVQKTPSTDYNLYQANKLDAALLGPQASQELKNQTGYTLRQTSGTVYFEMNQAKKNGLENANLRQALSLAINRQELAKAVGGANKPAKTLSPEGMTKVGDKDYTSLVENSQTKNNLSYNSSKAKELANKALKELGKSKVSYTILTYDDDASKKAGEFLQSSIESVLKNVNINVSSIPKKAALAKASKGNYDIFLMGWYADFTDPISFLNLNVSNNAQNWEHWSNKEYDNLISKSEKTANEAKRYAYLAKAEQVLINNQGVTPLYHPEEAWMVRPSVKNVIYNGAGANYNFKEAYMN